MKKIREIVITHEIDKEKGLYKAVIIHEKNQPAVKVKIDTDLYDAKVPRNENIDDYLTNLILVNNHKLYKKYDFFLEVSREKSARHFGKRLKYQLGKIINS